MSRNLDHTTGDARPLDSEQARPDGCADSLVRIGSVVETVQQPALENGDDDWSPYLQRCSPEETPDRSASDSPPENHNPTAEEQKWGARRLGHHLPWLPR